MLEHELIDLRGTCTDSALVNAGGLLFERGLSVKVCWLSLQDLGSLLKLMNRLVVWSDGRSKPEGLPYVFSPDGYFAVGLERKLKPGQIIFEVETSDGKRDSVHLEDYVELPTAEPFDWRPNHRLPEDEYAA